MMHRQLFFEQTLLGSISIGSTEVEFHKLSHDLKSPATG